MQQPLLVQPVFISISSQYQLDVISVSSQYHLNPGSVIAFEKSSSRHKLLCDLLKRSRCSSITSTVNGDFLASDTSSEAHSRVKFVIVDPSCSGSGIVTRLVCMCCVCVSLSLSVTSVSSFSSLFSNLSHLYDPDWVQNRSLRWMRLDLLHSLPSNSRLYYMRCHSPTLREWCIARVLCMRKRMSR